MAEGIFKKTQHPMFFYEFHTSSQFAYSIPATSEIILTDLILQKKIVDKKNMSGNRKVSKYCSLNIIHWNSKKFI